MSSSFIEVYRHTPESPWTYADLERRQEEVRAEVLRGEPGRLIFAEVAPVVTVGFRKTEEDLLFSREELAKQGVSVLEVSRGGRATYHGPGQWIVFPIDSLERLTGDRRGVRKIVDSLFEVLLSVARERFPRAEAREGKEAGIWTESGAGGAKLAALGIRIVDGVVQHGVSVNGFPTPESFAGIRPCGLDAPVAYFGGSFEDLRVQLQTAFLQRFPGFRSG